MDTLVNAIAADGTVRVLSAITTDTVAETIRRHRTSPTATVALGRVLTGTALFAASLKDFDRVTVKFDGGGPLGRVIAEADAQGAVRGYVYDPTVELPPNAAGKFDIAAAIGRGTLYVIRESGFELGMGREPYIGSVPIVSGEVAEDLAFYLARSEQIPSAVMLGVLVGNHEPYVTAAGGVLIQMLPTAHDHVITMIEDTAGRAPQVTAMVKDGATPVDLIRTVLGEIDFEVLGEKKVEFRCSCSKERAVAMVSALGKDEVIKMLEEDGGAKMNCGFCGNDHNLDAADLEAILADSNE